MLNWDLLNNAPRKKVSGAAFQLLTKLQDNDPETQVAATCTLFLLLCERYRMEPSDVFRMAKNALAFDRDKRSEEHFGAVRSYLANEI
jgi:hypothetical protein